MAKRSVQTLALILAFVLAVFSLCGCATIRRGADVVASWFSRDDSSDAKTPGKENKGGLFGGGAAATPEPTPPPSPKARFEEDLKTMFGDSVDRLDQLESMQLSQLFGGEEQTDESRSSRTAFSVEMKPAEPGEDEMLTISVETVNDVDSGDASFVMSAGAGEEDAMTGGVYFAGGDMLVRRGDTGKKLIRFPLSSEQAASYKGLSAVERMTRVFGGDESARKSTADLDKSVDDTITVFEDKTEEADYTEGTEGIKLLEAQHDCPSVTLAVKGEKARDVLDSLFKLLEEQSSLDSVLESSADDGEDSESIADTRKELAELTGDELAALELTVSTARFENAPVSVSISTKVKEKTTKMRFVTYKKGLEREVAVEIEEDDSLLSFADSNVNTGGDNYKGNLFLSVTTSGEKQAEMTATSTGTSDGANISRKIEYAITSYDTEDGTPQVMNGSIDWQQQKGADGSVSGGGSGTMELPTGEEVTKLSVSIKIEQTFGTVAVDAPRFLESAGIVVNSQEDLLEEMGIDKEEYKNKPFMEAALSAMFVLLN